MAVQVVTSMAIITTATTPCSSGATIAQRRVSSSCSSVPSRMVVGLEIGSKRRMGSLSLCNPQIRSAGILNSSEFLREKCSLALGNTVCRQAVQALSDTESAEGHVTIVEDSETFDRLLQEAGERLVVLDISTKTCGPCKIIFPKVVQLSIEYPDVMFLKINGDTSADTRALMRKWGVRAVPNFRFFRNGELVHSHTGAKLDELKAHLESHNNAAIKT
jgi:thioredoxin 1